MRTIGASARDIVILFVAEAFIVGLLGGIVGILIGGGIGEIYAGGEALQFLMLDINKALYPTEPS